MRRLDHAYALRPRELFRSDPGRYEGVRPINIHLLRVLFSLVFVFVGWDAWSTFAFALVVLPIVAMPWSYFVRCYVLGRARRVPV